MHLVPERGVPQQERDKAALDCLKIRAALLRAGQENNTFLVASAIDIWHPSSWQRPHPTCGAWSTGWWKLFNPAKFPWFKDSSIHVE
jgi:hypothetical protein